MGSAIFSRGPRGQFIAPSEALRCWLPDLLDKANWNQPLEALLAAAMHWCERSAGQHYRQAAEALEGLGRFQDPQARAETCVREAAKWFEYKRILSETLARVQAVR